MRFKEKEQLGQPELDEEEKLKQYLLAKAEISLLLDDYEDIFSDFDPRPYANRALSDDFLLEAKRAALDKKGALELSFMIPKAKSNPGHEIIIKKRLRDHFRRHALMLKDEINSIKRRGIVMALLGVTMIMVAAYLLSLNSDKLIVYFFIVLLEPGGWFTAWTGLDEIYYTTKQKKPDYEFYRKMTQSEITFHNY